MHGIQQTNNYLLLSISFFTMHTSTARQNTNTPNLEELQLMMSSQEARTKTSSICPLSSRSPRLQSSGGSLSV
ncbi:hypothetical protein GQ55_5G417100 [Panicum hallii var. hallii]|uniref:Uncharacterized protein n=1 Tax=Panicum hallii var. hallii TaxID=1504633 RepID=A0A2T7DNV8_9POAL|nr:hypothetical protein GQ55_5G417100 [Panicum hallii var. hallii]